MAQAHKYKMTTEVAQAIKAFSHTIEIEPERIIHHVDAILEESGEDLFIIHTMNPMIELRQQTALALDYIEGIEDEYSVGQRHAYTAVLEFIDEVLNPKKDDE